MENSNLIPKKIHYCWFGKNPLPELAIKCIESWKKYLPDYEIKEWNESNFDVNMIPYTKEAYEAKKYAFELTEGACLAVKEIDSQGELTSLARYLYERKK